eukprot:evm.model.scf_723.3 EVM.evm.TU.scf_723.3   scf_723:15560-17685(+)
MLARTRGTRCRAMKPGCPQPLGLAPCLAPQGGQRGGMPSRPGLVRGFGVGAQLPARSRASGGAAGPGRVRAAETLEGPVITEEFKSMSYSRQYDEVFKFPLNPKLALPKPSKDAQAQEPHGERVPLSDVVSTKKRPSFFNREYNATDIGYIAFMGTVHLMCLLAPFTFSWPMVGLSLGLYVVTGLFGITLSYHRQLSHRSFTTPKWLEYVFAYFGVLAAQGDPAEWVSSHRYHHVHTDTPMDPHSPFEGFWWSHVGWVLDNKVTDDRVGAANRNNHTDVASQPFYQHLRKYYILHLSAMFVALYALGGLPAVVWGGCVRLVWVWHITWFVNSASHVWGNQQYDTGDLSRNNWWVAILAFGEGWHNNHHAFEFSARHGLDWWQLDPTWWTICLLEKLGLAKDIKLPTEAQKRRLAIKS